MARKKNIVEIRINPCRRGHPADQMSLAGDLLFCWACASRTALQLKEDALFRQREVRVECWNCKAWVPAGRERCPTCGVEEPPF